MKGKVKEQWGKLTDDDLDVIAGKQDQLEGRLQQRYGYAKDQAARKSATGTVGRPGSDKESPLARAFYCRQMRPIQAVRYIKWLSRLATRQVNVRSCARIAHSEQTRAMSEIMRTGRRRSSAPDRSCFPKRLIADVPKAELVPVSQSRAQPRRRALPS